MQSPSPQMGEAGFKDAVSFPANGRGKFLENVIAPSPINGEGKFLGKVCQSLSFRRYFVCHFLHSLGEGVMGVLVYEEPAVIGG